MLMFVVKSCSLLFIHISSKSWWFMVMLTLIWNSNGLNFYCCFLPSYPCSLSEFCDWFQSPKIKAFIEKVIQCPLQDIAIPLFGFRWDYNKVVARYVAAYGILFFLHIDLYIDFTSGFWRYVNKQKWTWFNHKHEHMY